MSTVTVSVPGLKELERALLSLPDKVNRRVLRGSVAAGSAVVRDEMKTLAPVYTGDVAEGHPPPGTLKKAVYMKRINERCKLGFEVFYVGVRHGKSRQSVGKKGANLDAYYFRFVEFGTVKMAARPFMRPAFDKKKEAAVDAMKRQLAAGISAAAAEVKR